MQEAQDYQVNTDDSERGNIWKGNAMIPYSHACCV